jgi:hypothetical protein
VSLQTSYQFTLPRGYVDGDGRLHRVGSMRLATARDELAPLRDPTITGPDDPRLTILVLARVVERLGDLALVTTHEIEGLFAVDLAYLQDFYGVINFGTQEEYEALVQAQPESRLVGGVRAVTPAPPEAEPATAEGKVGEGADAERPTLRRAVEELPRRAL